MHGIAHDIWLSKPVVYGKQLFTRKSLFVGKTRLFTTRLFTMGSCLQSSLLKSNCCLRGVVLLWFITGRCLQGETFVLQGDNVELFTTSQSELCENNQLMHEYLPSMIVQQISRLVFHIHRSA